MKRIIIVALGTISIYNTDLDSSNIFRSVIFPLYNIYFLYFLFINFFGFLVALRNSGTKGNDVGIIDFLYDIFSLLQEEISSQYEGRFLFLGKYAEFFEGLVVQVEIVCVVVSFYRILQLLATLAY